MIFAYFHHSNIHFWSFLPSPVLDPYSCPPVSTCNKGEDQPSGRDKELVAAVFIKCLAECLDRVESTTINDHQRPSKTTLPLPKSWGKPTSSKLPPGDGSYSLYNVYTHFWLEHEGSGWSLIISGWHNRLRSLHPSAHVLFQLILWKHYLLSCLPAPVAACSWNFERNFKVKIL